MKDPMASRLAGLFEELDDILLHSSLVRLGFEFHDPLLVLAQLVKDLAETYYLRFGDLPDRNPFQGKVVLRDIVLEVAELHHCFLVTGIES